MSTAPTRRVNHGAGHSYVLDGRPVLGVTTVLNAMAKPALINWAAGEVARYVADNPAEVARMVDAMGAEGTAKALAAIPNANRDRKARRGTAVHALAERLAAGDEVEVPEEIAGYVASVVRFLDEWKVRPILSETAVYSRQYGYAGSLDTLGYVTHPDSSNVERVWLLDYKTASNVYGDTALQLAAYRYADFYIGDDGAEHEVPEVHGCAVVHVREDGYSVVPMSAGREAFTVFLHLLHVARDLKAVDEYWRADETRGRHPRVMTRWTPGGESA